MCVVLKRLWHELMGNQTNKQTNEQTNQRHTHAHTHARILYIFSGLVQENSFVQHQMIIMCWVTGIHHHYLEAGRNTHFVTIWRLIQTMHFAASLTDWPASARNDRLTVREKLKNVSMFLNGEKKGILYLTFWHKKKRMFMNVKGGHLFFEMVKNSFTI